MKKKVITLLLLASFAFSITGCSGKEAFSVMKSANKTEEANEEEIEEIEEEDAEDEEVDKKKSKKEAAKVKSSQPVLGDECEGYEEFSYLYEETLMTDSEENEKTGKMEKQKVTVFIPQDEYTYVDRDSASSEKLGVDFNVTLNPYLQYEEDDYLLSENMEYYLSEEYDEYFTADYKDLVVSEVEEVGSDAVRATVNYCKYDKWDEEYKAEFYTYYLKELDNGLKVMVKILMNPEEVTGKTDELINELEAFYEFEIDWDADAVQAKIDDFLANDSGDSESFSTGYLLFDLPKGWEQDTDYWDYSAEAYAPGGDSAFAGTMICFKREYMGSDSYDIKDLLKDQETTNEYFASLIGDDVSDINVEDYGTTCIGDTVVMSFTLDDGDSAGDYKFYFASDSSYLYAIQVVETDMAEEDAFSVAEDILENGRLK